MRTKLLIGLAAAGIAGTRAGREQVARIVGLARRRCAGRDLDARTSPAEEALDVEHPTPATLAVAVGAPNAPELDELPGAQPSGKEQ